MSTMSQKQKILLSHIYVEIIEKSFKKYIIEINIIFDTTSMQTGSFLIKIFILIKIFRLIEILL